MGGAVTWKPSVPRLLAGALFLSAAASAFLAATPWLRAYQVAGAPVLLALAVAVPVVISVAASRLLGARRRPVMPCRPALWRPCWC